MSLADIQSERGDQLLQQLRFYTCPPGLTEIPQLDSLLLDVHPRTTHVSTLNRGDVVELQGPPCSGKTELILFWTVVAALPPTWTVNLVQESSTRSPRRETIGIGGRARGVVVIDADGRFPLKRLARLMRVHLEGQVEEHTLRVAQLFGTRPADAAYDAIVRESLDRVHVFSPLSGLSLAATLRALPTYLRTRLPRTEMALLAIDSISAFHHQDAFRHEHAERTATHPLRGAIIALAHLRRSYGPIIVLSNWALSSGPDRSPGLYRQPLAPPYPAPFVDGAPLEKPFDVHEPVSASHLGPLPVTHHITLHLPSPPPTPFPPETSLEEMLQGERGRIREQTRRRASVVGVLRLPGITPGSAEAGRFTFRIGEYGVDVSDAYDAFA